MFSFPLFERLKAETPEFEQLAAFQAGSRAAQRAAPGRATTAARPLRSEYVTGNYFFTLGVGAFGGRVLTPDDDRPSAPPVAVLSHHAWQATYGGDPSVVGARSSIEGHPFTVDRRRAARVFRRNAAQRSARPVDSAAAGAAASPATARCCASRCRPGCASIGRLRPGATIDGMAPRLTGVLRQWMQHDSGYPSNWMPDVIRDAAEADDCRRPRRRRRRRDEGGVRPQPADPARPSAASCCSSPARTSRTCCSRARSRGARRRPCAWRSARRARQIVVAGAGRKRRCWRSPAASPGCWSPTGAARLLLGARLSATRSSCRSARGRRCWCSAFAFGAGAADRRHLRRGAGVVRDAHRSGRRAARLRAAAPAIIRRSRARRCSIVQATLSVVLVAGATMLARSLSKLEHQDFGYQVQGRVVVSLNRPPATYTQPKLAALYRADRGSARTALPGVQRLRPGALQPAHRQLGRAGAGRGASARRSSSEQAGASWDRVSANYLQNFGVDDGARARISPPPTTRPPRRSRSSTRRS